MKSYKKLVNAVLADGHLISVFDGAEWAVKSCAEPAAIFAAIESVEQAELRVRDAENRQRVLLWALIIPFGVGDDETVADHSCTEYAEQLAAREVL